MISIAMATYNGEKFIREQLDSILTQTITDWELIVCDDVSTDSTTTILEEYAQKDVRIKIYQNKFNLGFKRNFEKAIDLCTGEYIALCDQDDIWYPNHLEILLNQIGEYSLSVGNSDIVNIDNVFLNKRMSDTDGLQFVPQDTKKLIYRELLHFNPFQGASMLLRADFAQQCIPIPDEILFHDTWISHCSCMANGLIYTYNSVTRYRQHDKNITIDNHRGDEVKASEKVVKLLHKFRRVLTLSNLSTDRFAIIPRLLQIQATYNNHSTDFERICIFLENAKSQKLTLDDIIFLWENTKLITTSKSQKGFFRLWYMWSHMQPITKC